MGRTCGARNKDGTRCRRPVSGRRKWCDKHPGGRSKYKPPARRLCGAPTRDGTPCQRPLTGSRKGCDKHPGGRGRVPTTRAARGSGPISRRPRPKNEEVARAWAELTPEEQRRVEAVADFVVDVVAEDWAAAVASRASDSLDPKTWNRLFVRRSRRDCRSLARAAAALLEGKKKLHAFVGSVGARAMSALNVEPIAVAVARQLAARIPIPLLDAKVVTVARAMQIIGIAMCVSQRRPLERCQCFIDLSQTETQNVIKRVLEDMLRDITRIPEGPDRAGSPTKAPGQ
jgi:hypothetical protein